MEITYRCCASVDVHKKLVVASCLWSTENGKLAKETRSFGTTTQELLVLSSWLSSLGITHVAMESTGEYWKPIYNILESSFDHLDFLEEQIAVFDQQIAQLIDTQRACEPSCDPSHSCYEANPLAEHHCSTPPLS
jgi:poly-beta-hydroxyalkanoate depolymerase